MKIINETETHYNKIKEKTFAVENSEQSTELSTNTNDDNRKHKLECVKKSIDDCIAEYNKIYFKVTVNGKNYILRIIEADKRKGKQIDFFTHHEFKLMLIVEKKCYYKLNDENKFIYRSKPVTWITNERSNSAKNGVIFDPARPPLTACVGRLNLWQGFALKQSNLSIEAIRNDKQIKLYLEHVEQIICSGNKEYSKIVVQYLAHIFQKPEEKSQYALILKSGLGTGKGLFLHCIRTIIGKDHSDLAKNLHSNFNAYMSYALLIVCDDVNVCSKEATNMMKTLITEPHVSVEAKGKDKITVPSYSRFIFTTNEDAVVRIENDERRYFILRVSEKQKQNKKYFDKLHFLRVTDKDHIMFCRKLYSYFMNVDITDLDIANAPITDELIEEKINCFTNEEAFIYEMLENGVNTTGFTNTPAFIEKVKVEEIQERYFEFIKKTGRKKTFGCYSRKLGRALAKIGVKRTTNIPRDYIFKPLHILRKLFTEKYKIQFD